MIDAPITERQKLIDRLRGETMVFKDAAVEHAFVAIDRADFLGDDYKVEAYEDYAVPIGHGASTIQPTTLAFMLELLNVEPGNSVLNVGAGSGYSTALLADMVGAAGSVTGLEIVPELAEEAAITVRKLGFTNAQILRSSPDFKEAADAGYDRVLVTASSDELPSAIVAKLAPGGIAVIPVGRSLVKVEKPLRGQSKQTSFGDFTFEPLLYS
jgi:protein-L-isoaspartate(D-aspartate) O-methyltransferase